MKRKNMHYFLAIPLLTVAVTAFIAFKPGKSLTSTVVLENEAYQSCPSSCSVVLYDGCCPPPSGDPCTSDWKIPNFTWGKTATTVSFSSLDVCYKPSLTPPWSSNNLIGNLTASYGTRPSGTRVFSATASNGATFQCTVYTTGAFYIQQTGGPTPGKGASLSGSYSL